MPVPRQHPALPATSSTTAPHAVSNCGKSRQQHVLASISARDIFAVVCACGDCFVLSELLQRLLCLACAVLYPHAEHTVHPTAAYIAPGERGGSVLGSEQVVAIEDRMNKFFLRLIGPRLLPPAWHRNLHLWHRRSAQRQLTLPGFWEHKTRLTDSLEVNKNV